MISENSSANQCYLVGSFTTEARSTAHADLQELERLCKAAGLTPVGGELVRVRVPNPALYLGIGQADRIIAAAHDRDAAIIVFDREMSPVHLRNWARRSKLEVYDRHAVILEIFATRARTREAQLQVELARAEYAQSHLVGMWQHLSRQGGGSRLARGEGEKQIEMDRRQLSRRVQRARSALDHVGRQRQLRRRGRDGMYRVALVGYTNAGKSSLMNRLTTGGVRTADQLFATLDPTTRKLYLDPNTTALVSDTVGFVRHLPPELIEAFHSTLEEVTEADLLLLVADASDPRVSEELTTTLAILESLGAGDIPSVLVLNKIDRLEEGAVDLSATVGLNSRHVATVYTSAATGSGLDELRATILTQLTTAVS
ncbi:MAG TPA: GTPase HflX [Alkalispirochaeta sp.]|nr:GTPase HflX [Alkalispirochaeta sp.]